MTKGKIIPFPQKLPFSFEAAKRWNKIPKSIQKEILDHVWCGNCVGSCTVIVESAKIERDDLIIRGKCRICGNEVCRLIEPEN